MRPVTLDVMAHVCSGKIEQANTATTTRVTTDSRNVRAGDLFVALGGEHFDGHDYVVTAAQNGATGAMVRDTWERPSGLPQTFSLVRVADPLEALQRFATWYRRTLQTKVVAVGGSNGKTSTKEMVAAGLRRSWRTQATVGNLNNHIGVPLTLLTLEESDDAAVVELGTNHPGEIAVLAAMACPDVAVLTNIGPEHLEFFKDEAGVAQEEGALLEALSPEGLAVLNGDDPWTGQLRKRTAARVVTAGFGMGCDVRVVEVKDTATGQSLVVESQGDRVGIELPLWGRHMVSNAALAWAAGTALGLDPQTVAEGLAEVAVPGGRMRVFLSGGIRVIDDTYNANPASMRAALQELVRLPGHRVAVLGAMGELGDDAPRHHEEVGRFAAELGVDRLIAVGACSEHYRRGAGALCESVSDAKEAASRLKAGLKPGDHLLLKASRSARLELVLQGLGMMPEAAGH
jgi:UDP-N-acetylmuramoyl-tripeptide--D-alanyl-D-alanine ligase